MNIEITDRDFPALFRDADKTSKSSKKLFYIVLLSSLVLMFLTTLINSFIIKDEYFLKIIFKVSGLFYIIVLIVTILLRTLKWEKKWYKARAISESVKTLTWKYMTCSEPYQIMGQDVDSIFISDLKKILEVDLQGTNIVSGGVFSNEDQITKTMLRVRNESYENRLSIYLQNRVENQINWYTNRANFSKKWANLFYFSLFFIQGLAILFAFTNLEYIQVSYKFLALFSTISTSLLAWLQAQRYEELSQSYSVTAHDLGLVKANSHFITNDDDFARFVSDSENAISREHTVWRARRDVL